MKAYLEKMWKSRVYYLMMSFWLVFFIGFLIVPIVSAVALSFTDFNTVETPNFVFMDNYIRLFTNDDVFLISLKNTLVFTVITGPLGYVLSFVLAWFINDLSPRVRSFLTLLFYAPTLGANIYFVWLFIFSGDSFGFLNSFLLRSGLISQPVYWLSDVRIIMIPVIIVVLWMSMGNGFLAFIAGFQQLNPRLYEAAAIDGLKNRWQELWYITLPQMVPQLLIGAVLTISTNFAIGAQPAALTGMPSPEYATHTLMLHIQDHFKTKLEYGYSSAISVVLFLLMVISWHIISNALKNINRGDM